MDQSLPPEAKRKIREAEAALQQSFNSSHGGVTLRKRASQTSGSGRASPSTPTGYGSSSSNNGPSWATEGVSGHPPLRHHLLSEDGKPPSRAEDVDISASPLHVARGINVPASSTSGAGNNSPRNPFRRALPALQDPTEAFAELNKAMMQTLRYIDAVNDMDFDIFAIQEHDGTLMVDMERKFLSVCCSVFANFSLYTTLSIDSRKLVHFLGDIYTCYSEENAYHNCLHAVDALQMVSLFLRDPLVNTYMNDEEILLMFLAVLALDVAHPGVHDRTLAELNHPLATIFGDITTVQQGSLLVFLHELLLDENTFFQASWWSQRPAQAQCLLREALYDITTCAVPRFRPFLIYELKRIARGRTISHDDMVRLMSAIVSLSHHAPAFRPRRQSVQMGNLWCAERMREEEERERRGFVNIIPYDQLKGSAGLLTLAQYYSSTVRPLADAVRALVPTDLYDNLELNCDVLAAQREAEASNGVATTTTTAAASPLTVVTAPLSWDDNCALVVETLRKATTHANSLDRKASKCAILNASPPRTAAGVATLDWRAVSTAARSSPVLSAAFGASWGTEVESRQNSPDCRRAASPRPHHSRAEHYFSFLRLYNEFEGAGKPLDEFCGQLIFLALQLEPSYIAPYAIEKFGGDGGAAQCAEMAQYIITMEEAPTTAETIARPPLIDDGVSHAATGGGGGGGGGGSGAGGATDGFLLFLMDMYSNRCAQRQYVDEVEMDMRRSATPPPPPPPTGILSPGGANTGTSVRSFASSRMDSHRFLQSSSTPTPPPPPQRDSPIRLPVTTDSSNVTEAGITPLLPKCL